MSKLKTDFVLFWIDGVMESSPVIAEAVSYLTKKVDSKTRDVKVLQPTIATQTVSAIYSWKTAAWSYNPQIIHFPNYSILS